MKGRDLVALWDWSSEELHAMVDLALSMKKEPEKYAGTLAGKTAFLYFEKPSLRTRVTGETGMIQLGGGSVTQTPEMGRIGKRESVHDTAKNLELWCDVIGMRTFSQALVEEMAEHASIPVINLLTDDFHPCQALADLSTIKDEFGNLTGRHLAYVGDGNNVAHSLLIAGALAGMKVSIIGPKGFEPNLKIYDRARELAAATGAELEYTDDPLAVKGADAVYTDVWASMGQEEEAEARKRPFMPYQVNERLFAEAGDKAIFMHCLPAHRGEEVSDGVADHARSRIFPQAGFRLHVIKALYLAMIKGL
jgi:ornithine carbamoyltransferase